MPAAFRPGETKKRSAPPSGRSADPCATDGRIPVPEQGKERNLSPQGAKKAGCRQMAATHPAGNTAVTPTGAYS